MMDLRVRDGLASMPAGKSKRAKMTGERSEPRREKTLQILRALMTGDVLDAKSASERFGGRREGALRTLKALQKHVPGVIKNEEGRRHIFRFDFDQAVGGFEFDEEASFALAIAVSLGAAFARFFTGTRYRIELIDLRRAVIGRVSDAWKRHFDNLGRKFVVVASGEEILDDRAPLLDDVLEAVLKQKAVKMRYTRFGGEVETLVIEPLSLAIYDGHLYVVAAEDDRHHPYRFARIVELEVLDDQQFAYPGPAEYSPHELFADSIGIWLGHPEPSRVRLRLDPRWAIYARHHRWHRSQRMVSRMEDGSVELELRVRPCPELEQWVLRFGEGAEVLAPPDLRARIAGRLERATARYRERSSAGTRRK